jgi:hypothetical protein
LRTRVERRWPALSSLRGQKPAHEIKCAAVGKRAMSSPDFAEDPVRHGRVHAGNRVEECHRRAVWLGRFADSLLDLDNLRCASDPGSN